jgi:ribosome-binding protein aMBF1 (putative translation factor)
MSKNHRGTGLRALPAHGRGTCPLCHKTDIKVIYEVDVDGQKVKVCKYCNAALKNKAKKEGPKAAPAAAAPAADAAPAAN